MPANQYASLISKVFNGEVDFDTHTIKMAVCTSAYTPNLLTHDYFDDVTNQASGTNYPAGGATLASKTVTLTAADSWGVQRANSTAYAVGDVVRPATGNGWLYQCIVAGTSGGSIPTYTTVVGDDFTDGGVTWTNVGRAVTVLDAADPSFAAATLTGRKVVFYRDTGTPSTSPLIAVDEYAADVSSTNGTWTHQLHALGVAYFFTS